PTTFSNDIYGLDFGFNDPSVLIHAVYKEREVWLEQLIFRSGLTNQELIKEIMDVIPENKRNKPIYADTAEPDRIKEMRQKGLYIKEAKKSVKEGIDFVKRMKLHITKDSLETLKEIKGYSYKKDTKRNLTLDDPIPYADHSMDSIRYCLFTHLHNVATYRVRWI
ncbi:MAG: terminase large subunit, partial [Candidatus Nanoarchaeia archaeon]|nr:terminase large subunit [Candidatus Nanoarchaeia archaeon]